jgi:hypothetical protein
MVSKLNQFQSKRKAAMSVFNSVGTPLVILIVIIMVGAAIFGTSIAGADYLNPATSQAEAVQIIAETSHTQAVYEQEERVLKAQTESQIAKLNVDTNAYQEQVAQNLAHQKGMQLLELETHQRMAAAKEKFMIIIGYGLSFAMILAAILLAGARILRVIRSTKSKGPEKPQEISPTANHASAAWDPWQLPQYKRQMIQRARENEKTYLQAIKNGKLNAGSHNQPMTGDEYEKLPLAE